MVSWIGRYVSGFRWYILLPALFFLAVSTVFFLADEFWPWGRAVGGTLLFFSGKSSSEKNGYCF